MYSSSSPNRSQPYPWTGSPGRVSGPSTYNPFQPASTYAQWQNSTTYPSTTSTAGKLTSGSFPPATLYADMYSYDACVSSANTYQASGQASSDPYTYGLQVDTSTPFAGGSKYQGFNPTATAPSTSARGDRATTEMVLGHPTTYDGSSGNNIIHLSPYQPPSTPQEAESSKPSHKRKSRKGTTKATPKASQPAPAPAAPPSDDSDQEHAKKKRKTDEEKRRRKALQAQYYRAQHAEAVRHLEDALPEAYKTHDDPPGRETVARGVKYIKDMPAIHERNVELSRELEQRNLELRTVKKELDDARAVLQFTRNELDSSKFSIAEQKRKVDNLQNTVNYMVSIGR